MNPTYLYIKQHSVTDLLYFGKTQREPNNYNGSGSYWKKHIKKHGKQYIETLWYCLFLDENSIVDFAIKFSIMNNITKSTLWANLKDENGLDGNPVGLVLSEDHKRKISEASKGNTHLLGHKHTKESKEKMSNSQKGNTNLLGHRHSEETRNKISESNKGKKITEEHREIMSNTHLGIPKSDEHKKKLSEVNIGKVQKQIICPHCGKEGGNSGMQQWHFDNCKNNPNYNKYADLPPSVKFNDSEKEYISKIFKTGITRKEVYEYFKGKYSLGTINRAIKNYE